MTTSQGFGRIANAVAHTAGRPATFIACCLVVIGWAVSGPVFGFSDTWQLIINTGTTIVTFLMVFLIQNTQNRDGVAIQTKLDELIRSGAGHNRFVGIERLTEEELEDLRRKCEARAAAELKASRKSARANAKKARANGDKSVRQVNRKTARAVRRKVG